MKIEFLLAEADMTIERNKATMSGNGKYRVDLHSDLVTVCMLLRDELKGLGNRAASETRDDPYRQAQEQNPEHDYAGLDAGIVRAPYRSRARAS